MFEAIVFLLLTGLTWTVVAVLFGKAPAEKDRLYSFFALNGLLFSALVLLTSRPEAAPVREVLRLATVMLPSALLEVLAFFLLKLAMNRGSQGIAWCIMQSAMVLSFLGSIIFLKNPSSAAQWIGMALMLGSLALFGRNKDKKGGAGTRTNDATFFRLVFAAFILVGLAQFTRLLPGYMGLSEATLTWRLPMQAPFGLIVWTTVCLVKKCYNPGRIWKFSLIYGIVVTLGQILFYLATDAVDKLKMTSIIMPVTIGTCILFFTLYCRFFRKEYLSPSGWTAVAMNMAGIALLACRPG